MGHFSKPSKRAMAHHSGFERRILSYSHSLLLQAVPPVLPRGRGLAIPSSSFRVKHCTTSVYSGHGTCRGLRPMGVAHLNGLSLQVYISEELAKQQAHWLLDLCTRLGWVVNVKKSSLTPSQVATYLGILLDTRVGLAYPSERRIERWLSISGDFLAGQAQPALLWLRLLGHLASLEKLVPYGRLRIRLIHFQLSDQRSSSDPGQPGSRDQGFHSLVENSFESPQRNPTRVPSDRSLPLHSLKCCGFGCSHGRKDRLMEVVRGHERSAHQCAGTECDLAWSPSLRGYSPRLQCCHYV